MDARRMLIGMLLTVLVASPVHAEQEMAQKARQLRVCADPNNLPFSNEKREGFENRVAELIARELRASVQYTWWAQRRGFFRNTLNAGQCDLVMGVPSDLELVLPTKPYYCSTYMFISRKDRRHGSMLVVHIVTVASLALAVLGAFAAWRSWQRVGRGWPSVAGDVIERTRFMAVWGMIFSTLFFVAIVMQAIPSFILPPCAY